MSFKKLLASAAIVSAGLSFSAPAQASANPYLGEIMPAGYNFCPRGWAKTEGQLLPIASNTALFSLFGTMYGGDGRSTFGLPDLRGRAAINTGRGAGLPDYRQGERTGSTQFTLGVANLPSHNHTGVLKAVSSDANETQPTRNSMAKALDTNVTPATAVNAYSTANPANNMNAGDINILNTGGGQAVQKRSPFLTVQYCVATVGTYPSRN